MNIDTDYIPSPDVPDASITEGVIEAVWARVTEVVDQVINDTVARTDFEDDWLREELPGVIREEVAFAILERIREAWL